MEPTPKSLVRRRSDSDLMPPPPPAKKVKRPKHVLNEDDYTSTLSQIISRDFFPGIKVAAVQHEYLDAVESRNSAWISSAGRRLHDAMTPGRWRAQSLAKRLHDGGRTPPAFSGDTPSTAAATVDERPLPGSDLRLSEFQAKYTSEDNESFYKLLDKQNQKKTEKYAWMWNKNKLPSKQRLKQEEVKLRLSKTRPLVDDGFKRDRLAIKDSDDRPAQPDTWKFEPRNGLMFEPEGLEEGVVTVAQRAEDASRMPPKTIVYENTGIPEPHAPKQPPSPTMSSIRDAIAGRPRPQDRSSSDAGVGETPGLNGYTFVGEDDGETVMPESPPPINLGPGDAYNPFKLQQLRKRESLHERLVDRIAKTNKESSRRGLGRRSELQQVPKFPSSPRNSGDFTPAAQRLLSKMGTPKSKTPGSPFDRPATPAKRRDDASLDVLGAYPVLMRFVDLAIDLAAVLNASRSVAYKHVALRRRQIDAYRKISRAEAKPTELTGFDGSEERKGDSHFAKSSFATASKQSERDIKDLNKQLDAPVDVNVFHTARGSRILGSIRKGDARDVKSPQPGASAKEHPMRHWPQRPPVEFNNVSISSASDAVDESQVVEPESESSPPADKETVQVLAQAVAVQSPTQAYKLRESRVPASRFSRLWNYGGLAAGMLGGAMTESVSRAFGGGGQGSVMLSGKNMERLVTKLSRMRGAALKLGQMISLQDAKVLPSSIQEVLQRVQDKADYMPSWQRDRVLVDNLGADWQDLFLEFEETPMAAASIGQVHKAVLKSSGKTVAVKIQFPGVAASIDSDLDNLGLLLKATKLLPKGLYLDKTIDNARVELGWECDYEREAQCAKRYKELLRGDDAFLAPGIHPEASGKRVLTMDFMDGIAVTQVQSLTQEQRDWVGTQIMRLCLREITEFRFMQTDPNWTNFLFNSQRNKLELLDFGASRDYPEAFVRHYVQLLEAASRGDREGVRDLSQRLGYLTGHESKVMVDAHVDSVLTLAEPFGVSAPRAYNFKDQTITDRVRSFIPVMLRERLSPPPEETYSLHRKLSGAFLLCARLGSRVRCRDMFVEAVDKSGYVGGNGRSL
ncbi:hypothetical protein L249_4519 [Ophiocordyceps polyrhachis-furcata BCC 54312]|uniref:ABC1 atypical kinase-like domain-containing protein n=1 Tax=Ophiocordyceps polyrhachis-furcata BCC 54312 TaxID=1330021 RepID=A0A367KZT4_9HYPO|nr:hypothetical protein L249_4519 [Ophiocordyceps polyrhachis-furcata BCC 54312]